MSINAIVFPLIDLYSAIAAGVGFGAMHSFMYYAIIMSYAIGDGALFNPHCPHFSTFFSAAWTALFFNILHICWMILAFDSYRTMNMFKVGLIVALHAAAGGFVRTHDTPEWTARRTILIVYVSRYACFSCLKLTFSFGCCVSSVRPF